jgi:PAS domain S-box-containing protein
MNDNIRKLKKQFVENIITENTTLDNTAHFNHLLSCIDIDTKINQIMMKRVTICQTDWRIRKLIGKKLLNEEEVASIAIDTMSRFNIIPYSEYQWLKKVISIAENLPICITISSSKKEHFGFPLIYVNKHFEKTTGYMRHDIIGKNCKFLQPSTPIMKEETQYQLLTACLSQAIPTSVIITNVKKDGTPFYNLLSLKPVMDVDNNYLYNIGIQTEITTEPFEQSDIVNIIDVIQLLSHYKIYDI